MTGGLVCVVVANTVGQIRLNAWHGAFYDALEQRSLPGIGTQVVAFLVIACILLFLVVAQTWLQENIKVKLREWLTHDLVDRWLAPKRAYYLTQTGEAGANPDQYIQADARHLAETTATHAFGLLQCTLLLVSFVGVLWALSSNVVFTYGDNSFTIPGYMVWCALSYAAAGSFLTWLVGRPLIKLNAERYAREADLRFAIVRVNESSEAITLQGGEGDERKFMNSPIADVVGLCRQLAGGLARLTWVTSGYGWLGLIVPVLVALPGYFGGSLTLGGLMMVAGAFNQVQNALRWFVDNFAGIADWRATLLRVMRFRDNLAGLENGSDDGAGIAVAVHPRDKLSFMGLSIDLPDGRVSLDQQAVEIAPGDRVLIAGPSGCGRARLLRAVAGLASAGTGTILLPDAKQVLFMPAQSYLPPGTLRCAITYPLSCESHDDAAIRIALKRVDLAGLATRLEDRERWDKVLTAGEQQRVVLARLMMRRPCWIFMEDAAAYMNEVDCLLLRSIFTRELASSAVIAVTDSPALTSFYDRVLSLHRPDDYRAQDFRTTWPLPRLVAAE
jgi:putative ATP-binding cassette transporter